MAEGKKTGGRVKGTPNRKTRKLQRILEDKDFDPVLELIALAKDPETSRGDKKDICKDLVQYIYPKRKAVEHEGSMALTIDDVLLDDS